MNYYLTTQITIKDWEIIIKVSRCAKTRDKSALGTVFKVLIDQEDSRTKTVRSALQALADMHCETEKPVTVYTVRKPGMPGCYAYPKGMDWQSTLRLKRKLKAAAFR